MLKRIVDILLSFTALLIFSPVLIFFSILIYFQDFKNPIYIAERVGKDEKPYKMFKLRSMIVGADQSGVDSTSSNDTRITKIGTLVRKYKLDELTQLINVFKGDMSLVGPRPNVASETNIYSPTEKQLLSIKPGITDFASIVFSDEGNILEGSSDPDLVYNQLIRPWKSRLGLLYIENKSIFLDLKLIFATILAILSKRKALAIVVKTLQSKSSDSLLINICKRENKLKPYPPPGSKSIIMNR